MKKFVVLLVVVAMTCFSAMAFAAEVTVGGSFEVRSRSFDNLNTLKDAPAELDAATRAAYGIATADEPDVLSGKERDTQNRIRIDVNAKAGDVKGKLQLQSDFAHTWGKDTPTNAAGAPTTFETQDGPGSKLAFREAWVNFNLPGIPVNVTAGHQLLTLGNGWFFRSMHYGSDAWVVANQTGPNTVAFVNIKVAEGNTNASDDVDAYTVLDVFKLNDTMTIGVDLTKLRDRKSLTAYPGTETDLYNLGVNVNGKFGIVALKAEADLQSGSAKKAETNPLAATNAIFAAPQFNVDSDFKGNQLVLQAAVGLDPVNVNITLARGTGDKAASTSPDIKTYQTFLDVDPHYTFLYEYKLPTAAGKKNTGFANTTAIGAGASMKATDSLTVAADFWLLMATEDVSIHDAVQVDLNGNPLQDALGRDISAASDDLGMEVDVKLNWKLAENLAWNWTLGYFMPGDAYRSNNLATGQLQDADEVTGIQGILAFKF